jgi:hypothetical protein
MSKHTPGPWRVDETDRVVADNAKNFLRTREHPEFIVANNVYISGPRIERQANARLIAAAPEMLEALKKVEWFGKRIDEQPFCPDCGNYKSYGHMTGCELDAAIRKAEEGQ